MYEEAQLPSQIEQAAKQAAVRAATTLAKKVLIKIGAILGAKGVAIVAAIVAVIVLIILLIVLIVSVAGAAFQSSTAVWPVPVATDSAGTYQASGWTISSRYGWRDNPQGGDIEFHDGIDLTNPQGRCPFGYHCGIPSIFDGTVQYVGWDQSASGNPSKTGGGMLVIVANGQQDHQVLYAHLEPYRIYVQLQGKIKDTYGRYDDYRSYAPLGMGELQPGLSNGGIEMTCLNDMPNFIPTQSGPGTVVFMYDSPADCTTTVVWGERGDGWQGWTPDDPGGRAGDRQRAELRWQTPIDPGEAAKDVALRFRAHLVPPPPPPTEVPSATTTLTPMPSELAPDPALQASSGQALAGRGSVEVSDPGGWMRTPTAQPVGANVLPTPLARTGKSRGCTKLAGGWTRCVWSLADIPTEHERFVTAPDPWLVAAQAYASTQILDDQNQEDAERPAMPPAQFLPTASASPLPVSGSAVPQATPPTPTATPVPTRTPSLRIDTQPFDVGEPEQGISVVPVLTSQLLLHDPATNHPEHIGVLLTISDRIAEQVQLTMRREAPAILGPGDHETAIVDMPAGMLQNDVIPGFGFTVAPDIAPGVPVCHLRVEGPRERRDGRDTRLYRHCRPRRDQPDHVTPATRWPR